MLNEANQVPLYAGVHTYGVRKDTKKRVDRYGQLYQRTLKYHRKEHWREADRGCMLDLRNYRRFKMGMALVSYFIHNTLELNNCMFSLATTPALIGFHAKLITYTFCLIF